MGINIRMWQKWGQGEREVRLEWGVDILNVLISFPNTHNSLGWIRLESGV